jgi:hypothetical protein
LLFFGTAMTTPTQFYNRARQDLSHSLGRSLFKIDHS